MVCSSIIMAVIMHCMIIASPIEDGKAAIFSAVFVLVCECMHVWVHLVVHNIIVVSTLCFHSKGWLFESHHACRS